MTYTYNQAYFDYIEVGSTRSAAAVVPLIRAVLPVESVLDVGCGRGAWLRQWGKHGVEITGVDGAYVDPTRLLIPLESFIVRDLTEAFDLGRQFSLVQSLEVAEHLPEVRSHEFVASLCRHGPMVLFSAAPPGQGGENHINEQPYDYWREHFACQGYRMYDPFRSAVCAQSGVEAWYKYNLFLYVKGDLGENLPACVVQSALPEGRVVPDVSPWWYRARKAVFQRCSTSVCNTLARGKKHLSVVRHRLSGCGTAIRTFSE